LPKKYTFKIKCVYGKLNDKQKEYYNGQRLEIKVNQGKSYAELVDLKEKLEKILNA